MNQLITIENVVIRQDEQGLYCLNDFHRAAGSIHHKRPSKWLFTNQAQELIQELSPNSGLGQNITNVVKGGVNPGTYVCKELVYAYAMWISPTFNLKVIRTFDEVMTKQQPSDLYSNKINASFMLLDFLKKNLNLSNSSVLNGCKTIQQTFGLPNLTPNYAIDAPSDVIDGSSRPSFSLTHLLQKYEVPIKTTVAYAILKDLGIVERNKRKSLKTGEDKEFWSVTSYGLMYGKNLTPPNNQRETQPHFYESRFKELLKLMQNAKAA
ncbi:KilA-N domain-containing protein [Orbus wheelerorum]|uniref:KilA-N domain-containing protein n=1 Tax=Orbus wheelerorum TaxID=3074111 RepID=UPI00370D3A5E